MNYQNFKMQLIELVQEEITLECDDEVEVALTRVPKNNGIVMDGMVFSKNGENASPIVYLDEYYEFWKKGVAIDQLVEKILWNYGHCESRLKFPPDFFKNYEKMKSHIYYKVINYEKNREQLKEMPHIRILDMAMVFYYRVENVEPAATIMIQNSHLKMWKIAPKELEENARKYTCLHLPAEFLTMAQLAGIDEEMIGEMERAAGVERVPMYILTNKERQLGAGAIFYPGILKQAEELLGESFYVLPSSIHECILVPGGDRFSQEELAEMVTEINEDHVDPREVLSDMAYYYRKEDGKLHI
ncbi:MAG: hypothetical protein EOM40_00935 [Clostridia bacterium]|nr:hypothetical protein [Clostridia bacterium]NCC42474.1 hypothetical protein [Clostridia bacterium]